MTIGFVSCAPSVNLFFFNLPPCDFIAAETRIGPCLSPRPLSMLFLYAAATALVATSSRVGSGAVAPAVSWRQSAVAPAPRLGQLTLNSETAVVDALTKLFKAFDSNGDGFVTLSTMLLADRNAATTGGEWESRQACVGLGLEWR